MNLVPYCQAVDIWECGPQIKLMLDGSNPGAPKPPLGPGSTPLQSIADDASMASAVLLRDIHCAFLRVVEGKGCVAGEPPRWAKANDDDKSLEHWTQRVSLCLLRAPLDEVDEETRVIWHAAGRCRCPSCPEGVCGSLQHLPQYVLKVCFLSNQT